MFTEARVAILISLVAAVFSAWQTLESRQANRFNDEDLQVTVVQTSPQWIGCNDIESYLKVTWRIIIDNNSIQPALVRRIDTRFIKTKATSTVVNTQDPLEMSPTLPATIPAKTQQIYNISLSFPERESARLLRVQCRESSKFKLSVQTGTKEHQKPNSVTKSDLPIRVEPMKSVRSLVDESTIGLRVEVVTSSKRSFTGSGLIVDRPINPF